MQNISLVLKLCLRCTPCPRFFSFLPCYSFSIFCVNSFPSVYSLKTRFPKICCLGFAPAHPWHSSVFNISVSILQQVILKATAYNHRQVPEVWVWTSPCVRELVTCRRGSPTARPAPVPRHRHQHTKSNGAGGRGGWRKTEQNKKLNGFKKKTTWQYFGSTSELRGLLQ